MELLLQCSVSSTGQLCDDLVMVPVHRVKKSSNINELVYCDRLLLDKPVVMFCLLSALPPAVPCCVVLRGILRHCFSDMRTSSVRAAPTRPSNVNHSEDIFCFAKDSSSFVKCKVCTLK